MRGDKYFGVAVLLVGALLVVPLLGSASPAQRPGNTFDCIYFDSSNRDARICRVAANSLAMQWGTSAQTFSVYETFTSTSNYEALRMDSASNKARIYTVDDGSNGTAAALQFGVDSTFSWEISTGDDLLAVSDNVYDIGASGATRPRTGYFGTSVVTPTGTFATAATAPTITAGSGGNTIVLSATGTVYAGTARATHEVFLGAGSFLVNAGSAALAVIGGANAQGFALDASSDESISSMFKVPDGFAAVDATCLIGWSSTATTNDVIFDVITVPTAITEDSGLAGNTDSVTDTAGDTADDLQEASVTVTASTEWAANDIVYVTINRDADNGSDNLAADVSVHYFRCTMTVTDVQ